MGGSDECCYEGAVLPELCRRPTPQGKPPLNPKHAVAPSEPGSALERWLVPLTELARNTEGDLTTLVEANVRVQVENILKCDVIEREWKRRDLHIHGWVYELETGKLRDLGISVGRNGPLQV